MALDMSDGDWIPVFRKIRKNWIWKDPEILRFWLDLIMLANHGDGMFLFRGRLHHMKRGQVATTYKSLAGRNDWSRGRVKGCLELLEHDHSIVVQPRSFDTNSDTWTDTKTDTGFLLLTIVNYPLAKAGQELPTAQSAAESAGLSAGNRQRIGSGSAADRHIQEGEEEKQQQQQPKNVPPAGDQRARVDVDARVEGQKPPGQEGDASMAAAAAGSAEALSEEERADLLSRPNRKHGTPLLVAVGVDEAIAMSLAVQYPIQQVAGVAHNATGKQNPGGWAREALEHGWGYAAPKAELDQLAARIRQDRTARAAQFSRPIWTPAVPRMEGESDRSWADRIKAWKLGQGGGPRKEQAQ